MTARITERTQPAAYQAALVHAVLNAGLEAASDSDLDRLARAAGLRPPVQPETRDGVRMAVECPVDFLGLAPSSPDAVTSSQDIAQTVFDAANEGHPLVVIDADGRPIVLVPQPTSDTASRHARTSPPSHHISPPDRSTPC
ncbi:hypothetical protein ABZV34_23980 [Streptomyces sp. NPDC005195]|uniref:hypothetical protein n=1 Tax=Streptomyces sp. NPDC005195 TaxID=3154561 RepID=UPI0033AFC085